MGAPMRLQHARCLSSRRNPWQQNSDWMTTAKTGALVMLGAGALIASTSGTSHCNSMSDGSGTC